MIKEATLQVGMKNVHFISSEFDTVCYIQIISNSPMCHMSCFRISHIWPQHGDTLKKKKINKLIFVANTAYSRSSIFQSNSAFSVVYFLEAI